jgi:ankyrin repeat protein
MASEIEAFFDAVKAGDTTRVRDLLASEPALVRATDDEGATALHHAAERGHGDVVRLLLEKGAAINARDDRFAATPTGWAIEYLRGLGGLLAIEIEDMLFAIREGDARWARRLLGRRRALLDATDAAGKPLSEHAAECGNEEIARLFWRRQAADPGGGGDRRG